MKNLRENTKCEPPDGGWGWVVAVAASINLGLTWGLQKSYGLFMIDIMDLVGTNAKLTGGAGGLCSAMGAVLGPIVAVMMRKFGIRWVCVAGGLLGGTGFACGYFAFTLPMIYFSYSIMYGAASSLISMCSFGVINVYFRKRHGLAQGITMAGVGVSAVVSSQVINALVDAYTYRGAFLITGAIVLHSIPCALTFMPLMKVSSKEKKAISKTGSFDKQDEQPRDMKKAAVGRSNLDMWKGIQKETLADVESSSSSHERKRNFHWKIFKDVRFWFFALSMCLMDISYLNVTVYLPFKSVELKPDGVNEATMVSIFSIMDAVGQITFGLLWDSGRFRHIYERMIGYILIVITTGCAAITFSAIHNYNVLYLWVGIAGILFGATLSPCFIMIKNMVGEERYTDFLSADLLMQTPGLFLGPVFIGFIYDNLEDTGPVFTTLGLFLIVSGIIAIALPVITKIWYDVDNIGIPRKEEAKVLEHSDSGIQYEEQFYDNKITKF